MRDQTATGRVEPRRERVTFPNRPASADPLFGTGDASTGDLGTTLVARLDRNGVIVEVDEWWRRSAEARGLDVSAWEGVSYLAACDTAKDDELAECVADGLRAVLAGERDRFVTTYPCHGPDGERWYRMLVSPLADGAMVLHVDVSSWIDTERSLDRRVRQQAAISALRRLDLRGFTALLAGLPPIAIEALGVERCELIEWPIHGSARVLGAHGDGPAIDEDGLEPEPWRALGLAVGDPHVESSLDPRSSLPGATRLYEEGTRSVVATLLGGEESLGLMLLHSKQRRCFERDELQLIETMGHLVSAALVRRHQTAVAAERQQTRDDLLRQAQALGKMGAWAMNLQTKEVDCEPAALRLFGVSPEEFDGSLDTFLARVLPEDRPRLIADHRQADRDHPSMEAQYRIVKPDGSIRWMFERDLAQFDDEGNLVRRLGMVMDITERKRRETALLASEERFRGVFENAAAGIAICDASGTIVEANQAFSGMLGEDPSALRGRTLEALTHPADTSAHRETFERLRSGELASIVTEKRYLHRDGHSVWVRASKGVQRNAAGEVTGVICVAEDVSQRRAAERALLDHQSLLRMASRLSHMGAWSVSVPDSQVTWSDEVRAIHGVPPGFDPDLEDALAFYRPESRAAVEAAFDRCVSEGTPFDLELRLTRADDRPVWARSIGEAVRNAKGDIIRVQGAFQDITQRKEAATRERQLVEWVTNTLESINEGFLTVDGKWQLTHLNGRIERWLGRPRSELLGRSLWDILPAAGGCEFGQRCREALETQRSMRFETSCELFDGFFEVHAQPVRTGGLAIYLRDVTDERLAQEAVQRSEQRFRELAEHIDDAFFQRDPHSGELTYVSDAFKNMWGGDIDSLEDARRAYRERRQPTGAEDGGWAGPIEQPNSFEYAIVHPNGERRWLQERAYPVLDESGAVARVVGTMRDITERRALDERLRAQAALLDEASDAIIATDRAGAVTFWNRCAERMHGICRAEALGRPLAELIAGHDDDLDALFRQVLDEGEWAGELELADERVMRARWTALDGPAGAHRGILAIHSDVTDEKLLQSQFLRAQRLESIGTLAGGIAHDLNNILTPMLLAVEVLRDDVHSDDGTETLRQLELSGQRGAALVQQVLTFARGDDGEKHPISVSEQVCEVASICRDTFPRAILVQTEVPEDDWPVLADRTQVHQVLMNLCVNARDALTDGGELTIGLSNVVLDAMYAEMNVDAKPGPYTLLTVRDSGCGMDEDTLDRIFEPFYSTKAPGKGTGLGLSTSFSIIRDHGGFIHVYSEPGGGTEFKVYLPALEPGTEVDSTESAPGLVYGNGELILVVEDDESIRRVTRRTLERFGYRVLCAGHGAEAVGIYAEHRRAIAAVFTDMSMPVMDGPAMIVALRSMDPDTHIIGTSGLYDYTRRTAADEEHVDRFIGKPYTAPALLEALDQVLRGASASGHERAAEPEATGSAVREAVPAQPSAQEGEAANPQSSVPEVVDKPGPETGGTEGSQAEPTRILVVDDEAPIRRLMARVLRAPGQEVTLAEGGTEALAMLAEREGDFDLVITDVQMAKSTGLDLAREAKNRWPSLRFLFMSGDPAQCGEVKQWGELLAKPLAPASLREAVRRSLEAGPRS